jgi:ribosomal protein L6P/L9E
MSRIGKKPIDLPADVEVNIEDGQVQVTGPRGVSREPCQTSSICSSKTINSLLGKGRVQASSGTARSHANAHL